MNPIKEQIGECCPPFDPSLWDDKLLEWQEKPFIKANVRTFFYMPINFGSVMKKLDLRVRNAKATVPDWLCLSDHTSQWNMNLLLAVDKPITGANNTSLSGLFYSKVYEGPFRDTGKWNSDYKKGSISKRTGN